MHPTRILATVLAAGVVLGSLLPGGTAHALEPPVDLWDETTSDLAVSGTYTPLVGDFGGAVAGRDDILWYAPGAATDYLWLSDGDRTFTKAALPTQVSGTYTPIVGDFAGNALDDVLWYAPGAAADYLWTSLGGSFSASPETISGTYLPAVLDDTAGKDDILWANPAGGPGSVWSFEGGGTHLSNPITSPAGSKPLVGHFNTGVCADVFWYASGPAADSLWHMNCAGHIGSSHPQTVNGTYQPVVSDLTPGGDGFDDILWFRHPSTTTLWESEGGDGKFAPSSRTLPIGGTPLPVAKNWGLVQIWSPTLPDLVFWRTGEGGDFAAQLDATNMGAGYRPLIGNFVGTNPDIFWYQPGNAAERLFSTP